MHISLPESHCSVSFTSLIIRLPFFSLQTTAGCALEQMVGSVEQPQAVKISVSISTERASVQMEGSNIWQISTQSLHYSAQTCVEMNSCQSLETFCLNFFKNFREKGREGKKDQEERKRKKRREQSKQNMSKLPADMRNATICLSVVWESRRSVQDVCLD